MNKKALELLKYLVSQSPEGNFVVLEKKEILKDIDGFEELSLEEIDELIKFLNLKKYIDVKVQDIKTFVARPTHEGFLIVDLDCGGKKAIKQQLIGGPSIGKYRLLSYAILGGVIGGCIVAIAVVLLHYFA